MYYNDYNRPPQEPIVTNDFQVDGQPVAPAVQPRKKGRAPRLVALGLVCALVGGVAGGAAVRFVPGLGGRTTLYESTHAPVAVELANINRDQPMTGAEVYASNVGSAVGITTELVTTNFWGQRVKGAAAGSGFVVTHDGYILTNYHVIDGASSIQVAFENGKSYPATLVGGEESNDIAVLKIEPQEELTPVVLGDSDNLVVGEQVCAIGNPLGELTFTFTAGYVSARDRTITMENGERMNMLQTDTAINSGNSGGPLFNMYGEVIGITSAKYSSSSSSSASIEGIGFAIPINDVKDMVTDIIQKGYVTGKPNVGILMNDVSSEATLRYGIPAGAYVEAVLEGSCGEKAGLKAGDIITAVGENAVASSDALASQVKEYKAGETVQFTVYREGEYLTLDIALDENDLDRAKAMDELQQSYRESQQQVQQQQSSQGYSWPFGGLFGW